MKCRSGSGLAAIDLTRDRSVTLAGPPVLVGPAVAFLVATVIIAIIRVATYFETGIWF